MMRILLLCSHALQPTSVRSMALSSYTEGDDQTPCERDRRDMMSPYYHLGLHYDRIESTPKRFLNHVLVFSGETQRTRPRESLKPGGCKEPNRLPRSLNFRSCRDIKPVPKHEIIFCSELYLTRVALDGLTPRSMTGHESRGQQR